MPLWVIYFCDITLCSSRILRRQVVFFFFFQITFTPARRRGCEQGDLYTRAHRDCVPGAPAPASNGRNVTSKTRIHEKRHATVYITSDGTTMYPCHRSRLGGKRVTEAPAKHVVRNARAARVFQTYLILFFYFFFSFGEPTRMTINLNICYEKNKLYSQL